MLLISIARASHFQCVPLARVLLRKYDIARQHLQVYGDTVILLQPFVFSDLIYRFKNVILGHKKKSTDEKCSKSPSGTLERSQQFLWRLIKQWAPSGAVVALAGIRQEEDL
eukprot:12092860-Karenia_brevis.AAC.1